ncbi:MAG: tRNA lysidine(34) synthetase TilS [Pseudomonadota bacterium]
MPAPEPPAGFPAPPPAEADDAGAAARVGRALAARLADLAPGAFGVAVSGGGDSVALLLAASDHAAATGARIEAVTVDHGLRPASATEAEAVAALCARLSIPHTTLRWTDRPRGNLPAAAREARARLISAWAAARALPAVALGHTRDDQAETVLLRLARGSGLDGLSAMRETARRENLLWLRPALALPRADLRAFLRARRQGWFDDPTNEDPAHDRVRARHALTALAPLGLTAGGLAETAGRLAGDSDHLRAESRALTREILTIGAAGELRLDRPRLRAAPPPLRRRRLARLLRLLPHAPYPPRHAALAALEAALTASEDAPPRTLHGCLVWAQGETVLLCREPAALPTGQPPNALWDARWRLTWTGPPPPAPLTAGPLGEPGLAALRALERAGDWPPPPAWAAAPRAARLAAPALWAGEALAAAPLAVHGPARAEDRLAPRLLGPSP